MIDHASSLKISILRVATRTTRHRIKPLKPSKLVLFLSNRMLIVYCQPHRCCGYAVVAPLLVLVVRRSCEGERSFYIDHQQQPSSSIFWLKFKTAFYKKLGSNESMTSGVLLPSKLRPTWYLPWVPLLQRGCFYSVIGPIDVVRRVCVVEATKKGLEQNACWSVLYRFGAKGSRISHYFQGFVGEVWFTLSW